MIKMTEMLKFSNKNKKIIQIKQILTKTHFLKIIIIIQKMPGFNEELIK